MARQSLIWTALPNGFTPDGSGLRLSAMVSPRLDPQAPAGLHGTLGAFFPDWEDWPKTLSSARLDVTFDANTVSIPMTALAGPSRVDATVGVADSAVWKALFDATTAVAPFRYADLSSSVLLSYDAMLMAETLENLYRDLARKATDRMPLVTELLETERWRGFVGAVRTLDRASINGDTGLREPRLQFDRLRRGSLRTGDMLARFQLFHTPPAASVTRQAPRRDDPRIESRWREHRRGDLPTPDEIADTIDFHRIVAAMGSYPTLLRRLGLVVDLVVARAAFAAAAAGNLSVNVVFPPGALQVPRSADGSPVTRARLSASRFDALPDAAAATPLVDGRLDLQPARFGLLQVDVDGAGLKAMNFARSLDRRFDVDARVDPVTRQEDELGTPALRTGGLMLVQRQRAQVLANRFDANNAGNAKLESQLSGAAATVTLHAQDLVRGYRVDVWDSVTRRWQSLCRRTARYELGDPPVIVDVAPEEESTVQLAATRSSDPTSNADVLYLHEALVSWTGWSLAARQPGRAIGRDDGVDRSRDDAAAEMPPGVQFSSSFAPVKGSLPRLRFGRSYWLRARAVDLAGNSLAPSPLDYGNEQPAVHATRYLRYEPVAAPVIALLSQSGTIERPREGESMQRIAIRSFNDTVADNVVATAQVAHRAAAPARTSVRDAEQHGKLDVQGKVGSGLFDLLANRNDVDPRDPSAAMREATLLTQGPLDDTPAPTTFAVYEQGRALTYLPDPLAQEVAVRVLDHPNIADSTLIRIPWYPDAGDWPQARPFVIEVYDDPMEAPYYDASSHRLRVPLPKGVRAKLKLSTTLSPEALALLGVFQWLAPDDQDAQRVRALSGQHWMLTPATFVEVVHAVQRPLLNPDFLTLAIRDRALGQTSAVPLAQVVCSIDSTDRLDLYAEWHEPRDDPSQDASGPVDRTRRDAAFQVKVTAANDYATGGVAPGTPDHTIPAPDVIAVNGGHERVAPKAHEFHDTRYRRIEYWFDATSRFREFLPASLLTTFADGERVPTDANIKVTGARQVAWIPNAAPPPAPKVLYVVPTFAWHREVDAQGALSSARRGGALRIYLDRGWNASGYGEMLGVVLPPQGFAGDPDADPPGAPYKQYVTLWGNDPIWDSAFVPGLAPTLAHFPLARTAPDPAGAWLPPNAPAAEKDQRPGPFRLSALAPPGQQGRGGRVDVAPHDVFYDDVRQLWYCDVEIAMGAAYFPFMRLALARYQPTSSPGAHLSNVVLSDIIAVAPHRFLNVTPEPDTRSVRVALFGVGYDDSSGHHEAAQAPAGVRIDPATGLVDMALPASPSGRPVVEVWIERFDPGLGEDFGWQRVADALVTERVPGPTASPAISPATLAAQLRSTREPVGATLPAQVAALRPAQDAGALSLWSAVFEGDVVLPAQAARYRLVVTEYEEYLVDDARPYDRTPTRKDRRIVFVEHVEFA